MNVNEIAESLAGDFDEVPEKVRERLEFLDKLYEAATKRPEAPRVRQSSGQGDSS